jgi:hypothetical protein
MAPKREIQSIRNHLQQDAQTVEYQDLYHIQRENKQV